MTATLTGTLPELQDAYDALEAYGQSKGITVGIADFGGLRSQADTTKILNYRAQDYAKDMAAGKIRPDTTIQQYRPISPFGSSFHNYGAAFDILVVARPAKMTYGDAQTVLGNYAPSIGLRWGGKFQDRDYPHFELAIPISEAKTRWAAQSNVSSGNIPSSGWQSILDAIEGGPVEDSGGEVDYGDTEYGGGTTVAKTANIPDWAILGVVALALFWLARSR